MAFLTVGFVPQGYDKPANVPGLLDEETHSQITAKQHKTTAGNDDYPSRQTKTYYEVHSTTAPLHRCVRGGAL
jgi:hypothetical protein